MPSPRCVCAHADALHHDNDTGIGAGACRVALPPYEEEELPEWRCPCPLFRAAPAGPWRWHTASQTWALVTPVTLGTPESRALAS